MRRRAAVLVAVVMLLRSAWDVVPFTRTNWTVWWQLRRAHAVAPDEAWDRYFALLTPYLLPHSPVGLVQFARPGTPQRERDYYFLQYSLAPRLIAPSAQTEFIIVFPPAAATSLIDTSAYVPVKTFDNDFALYRRMRQ